MQFNNKLVNFIDELAYMQMSVSRCHQQDVIMYPLAIRYSYRHVSVRTLMYLPLITAMTAHEGAIAIFMT